jgi:dolichol-phosphate mannosyltransferase
MTHIARSLRLAVVVPLANEEKTVNDFLRRVVMHLGPEDRVFCVFDNVCKDRTLSIVKNFSEKEPRVEIVWAPENRCVVDAYFRGFEAAYEAGTQWILEMDGGLSHQPEEIPQFLKYLDDSYDFIVGCRFIPGGSHTGSKWRSFVSWAGGLLSNVMLGTTMRDMTSGFEMFSRKAMAFVLAKGVRSRANFFQTEIKYMLRNWNWIELPITYISTKGNVPKDSIRESIVVLWQIRKEKQKQE